jgi:hypothetical protein
MIRFRSRDVPGKIIFKSVLQTSRAPKPGLTDGRQMRCDCSIAFNCNLNFNSSFHGRKPQWTNFDKFGRTHRIIILALLPTFQDPVFYLWRNFTVCSPDQILFGWSDEWRIRLAGHLARLGEKRNAYRICVWKPEGKRSLGRPRRRWG